MTMRNANFIIALLALTAASGQARAQSEHDAPYITLREAYAARDPARAASAYADSAIYTELYPGAAPAAYTGRERLRQHFEGIFAQFATSGAASGMDLNFRFVSREKAGDGSVDAGFYRLRIPGEDGGDPVQLFGRFAAASAKGRFVFDSSGAADLSEFESAPGSVFFDAENEHLDAGYYDRLTGTYLDENGCRVLVTRSMWRLFALDECSGRWRGLERDAGERWRGGARVIDPKGDTLHLFVPEKSAAPQTLPAIATLRIEEATGAVRELRRRAALRREQIEFSSSGIRLRGELLFPERPHSNKSPAVVLIHGSGEQDRHGYASIIRILAERFVRAGFVVLSYDKRGVGGSMGDWTRAGFETLAADAGAALSVLRARPEVDSNRVGIAGSSQAGWVAASVVRDGASPGFVVLVGAAGAALTVEEQNLYNTEVRMRCDGIPESDIALALQQQRAFFAARREPGTAARLTEVSKKAAARQRLVGWLFPDTVGSAQPQWYDVLDPDFDPNPIWAGYRGRSYFLFAEYDDSTPSSIATARLQTRTSAGIRRLKTLPGTQHLGLRASSLCAGGEIGAADGFHPDFFPTLDGWLTEIVEAS